MRATTRGLEIVIKGNIPWMVLVGIFGGLWKERATSRLLIVGSPKTRSGGGFAGD